jgi:cytoskeletal protein CcmA (bactofilin family)
MISSFDKVGHIRNIGEPEMTRLLLTTAVASVLALTGCIDVTIGTPAYASSNDSSLRGGDFTAVLDEPGDFRLAGADVRVSGEVSGRLRVSAADFIARDFHAGALTVTAADIAFTGDVDGPVTLTASDVSWRGSIGESAEIRAADLDFDGRLDGRLFAQVADARLSGVFHDLEVSAADLELDRNSHVQGDVRANVADFELDGVIDGRLDLSARSVWINGDLNAPMVLNVDPGRGRLDPEDGLVELNGRSVGGSICARRVVVRGQVNGPLTIMADAPPEMRDGAQASDISFTARNGQRCERNS